MKKGWYYLAAIKQTALLKEITSKNNANFYCLNYLHSFRTENKLKCHEKYVKVKENLRNCFGNSKNNVSKFNQYMKSDQTPYISDADLESLIKETYNCKNNPEKSSTTKIGKHIPWAY